MREREAAPTVTLAHRCERNVVYPLAKRRLRRAERIVQQQQRRPRRERAPVGRLPSSIGCELQQLVRAAQPLPTAHDPRRAGTGDLAVGPHEQAQRAPRGTAMANS